MTERVKIAPGAPGFEPRWTSSAKSGVGTALSSNSRVWFTLSHGIFNEIYYPRLDQACTRDLGLIVTDGHEFFSEEKRHTRSEVSYLEKEVPAYRLLNTCNEGRYCIKKVIFTDPDRDAVLQRTWFQALQGRTEDYHLFALLAPHLGNFGAGNTAWIGEYKGTPMLFAERDDTCLALASSTPWLHRSAGYVGSSDGWQDLSRHRRMWWEYERAEDGNVCLTGELDLSACANGEFLLVLAFGRTTSEAGLRARACLFSGFEHARTQYSKRWRRWQEQLIPLDQNHVGLYRVSTAVLRVHESSRFPGGLIASLSIPWGFTKGDDDLGGYHLAWPRDLVETAGGLLAAGAGSDLRRVLDYLRSTQESDGHWPQNMWLDGSTYWTGVQMDETAFPILLVDLARREGVFGGEGFDRYWDMVFRAAAFLIQNGPVTQQDRWEEDPGYSPFTLAVEVAALLAAADMAELRGNVDIATFLRETADAWNEGIERWTYVRGTDLAQQFGVDGYYVRVAPPDTATGASPVAGFVPIKNRPPGESLQAACEIVSPDALALVRFGLRAPDDPRIRQTVTVIDGLLKVETPAGPLWRRYNDDGYGEHADGSPFDGTGTGRAWPLLTGERAHYELAAGHRDEAERLMRAMESFANEGGLLPEQIWDSPDIPERELFFGRPSGSAMPLVWAHAEYVKLRRSLRDGRVFDMPPQTVERYIEKGTKCGFGIWRFNLKSRCIGVGRKLRIEVLSPALIHWTHDNWSTTLDSETRESGLGVFFADLDTDALPDGTLIDFTFYWREPQSWEGKNFQVRVGGDQCPG
ncbi:MAG: glucan 1,4-alpha-glucosidase [Acidobacteriota bacterium]